MLISTFKIRNPYQGSDLNSVKYKGPIDSL